MKLSPKFILAFVLLMLSFSMGGNAMNFSAYASNYEPLVNYQNRLLMLIVILL